MKKLAMLLVSAMLLVPVMAVNASTIENSTTTSSVQDTNDTPTDENSSSTTEVQDSTGTTASTTTSSPSTSNNETSEETTNTTESQPTVIIGQDKINTLNGIQRAIEVKAEVRTVKGVGLGENFVLEFTIKNNAMTSINNAVFTIDPYATAFVEFDSSQFDNSAEAKKASDYLSKEIKKASIRKFDLASGGVHKLSYTLKLKDTALKHISNPDKNTVIKLQNGFLPVTMPYNLLFKADSGKLDVNACPIVSAFQKNENVDFDIDTGLNGRGGAAALTDMIVALGGNLGVKTPSVDGVAISGGSYSGGSSSSSNDSMKNKPKLIISKYSINPKTPQAGDTFELTMTFLNTNSKRVSKNIKIILAADESGAAAAAAAKETGSTPLASGANTFTPVNSSNTLYISSIDPEESANKTISFEVSPTAASKTHNMLVVLEYEDSDGNQLNAKETIGIPVRQTPKIDVDGINVPETVNKSDGISLDFGAYNIGKDNLSNFMVELEGGFTSDPPRAFIGNFNAGASATFSFTLAPKKEGKLNGKIRFSYEDSTGKSHEIIKEFNTVVTDDMSMLDMGKDQLGTADMQVSNTGMLGTGLMYLLLAVLAAIIIAVIIIIRQRKKAKMQKDLELNE